MNPPDYSQAYKQFFSNAVVRRYGESLSEVMSCFDERFTCDYLEIGDIPNSKCLMIRDTKNNFDVFKFTRYDFDALKKWIVETLGMRIVFEKLTRRDDVADFGVLLIQKQR